MAVVLLVEYLPAEGRHADLVEALTSLAPLVHAEEGCEKYAFHTTKDKVFLIEKWTDKQALAAHAEGEPIAKLRAATKDLLSTPPTITALRPAPSGDGGEGEL